LEKNVKQGRNIGIIGQLVTFFLITIIYQNVEKRDIKKGKKIKKLKEKKKTK
jgi:hypothetical protein